MGHIDLAAPVAHVWYTRRVPSYLGLLLDISRRNLDRVLYFAQYVVTHVDEEARRKAVKRIEEEIARLEKEQADGLNQQIAQLKAGRKKRIEDLDEQDAQDPRDRSTRTSPTRIEPVIQEGQRLEALADREARQDRPGADPLQGDRYGHRRQGRDDRRRPASDARPEVGQAAAGRDRGRAARTAATASSNACTMQVEKVKAESDLAMVDLRNAADEGGSEGVRAAGRRTRRAGRHPPDDVPGRDALPRAQGQVGPGLPGRHGRRGLLRNPAAHGPGYAGQGAVGRGPH